MTFAMTPPVTTPLRLVVFDVDGTLIDSGDAIVAAMRAAFDHAERPWPTAEAIRRIVGLELYEAVERLAPDLDEPTNRLIGDAYKDAFVKARQAGGGEGSAPLYDGARSALERLHGTEALMGVATGKARRGLDHTLDAHDLREFFITTQTCSENPGKPNPGMIESACRETGVDARHVVMIGDTVFDIEMAMNAGARAIGVGWGYHEPDELRDAGAEVVLDRFRSTRRRVGADLERRMMGPIETIPARQGVGLPLAAGETVRVINTHGSQVVDAWAFCAAEPTEFLSLEHWRVHAGRLIPQEGDAFVTNRRRAILTIVEDTSGGPHDTLCAACDRWRYWSLGHPGDDVHANCTDNLRAALIDLGLAPATVAQVGTPSPLNIFQNVPPRTDGAMIIEPPQAAKGGYVALRAEMDALVVFSACPMDMADTNGADRTPRDAHYQRG